MEKAESPMEVRLSGSVTVVREEQKKKAPSPMARMPSGTAKESPSFPAG